MPSPTYTRSRHRSFKTLYLNVRLLLFSATDHMGSASDLLSHPRGYHSVLNDAWKHNLCWVHSAAAMYLSINGMYSGEEIRCCECLYNFRQLTHGRNGSEKDWHWLSVGLWLDLTTVGGIWCAKVKESGQAHTCQQKTSLSAPAKCLQRQRWKIQRCPKLCFHGLSNPINNTSISNFHDDKLPWRALQIPLISVKGRPRCHWIRHTIAVSDGGLQTSAIDVLSASSSLPTHIL